MESRKEDDDDDEFEALYTNGHWEWKDEEDGLVFIASRPTFFTPVSAKIEFKDDMDIIEQHKFKRRFQRKSTIPDDVVTLQDIKDFVLFTTPIAVLSESVINILHRPSTERFLRALILYMQYFIQISEEMTKRQKERETKLRTPRSHCIELEYRENIQDLRVLVSKEYSTIILGGGEYRKYHHMGPSKKSRSLSGQDQLFYESLISIFTQIVWITLDRKKFNKIENEINRLFRSYKYNIVDHKNKKDSVSAMTSDERYVLITDSSVEEGRAPQIRTPFCRELIDSTYRDIDFRTFGLGVLDYDRLNQRLQYLENALILPELQLESKRMTLGIIGLKRNRFDIMLREIKLPALGSTISSTSRTSYKGPSRTSRVSGSSQRRATTSTMAANSQTTAFIEKLIPDLVIPRRSESIITQDFPTKTKKKKRWCNDSQRRKWIARLTRWKLTHCLASQGDLSTH